MAQRIPFRLFDAEVLGKTRLSPSLSRVVLGGGDLADACTLGPDQRIKIFFPNDAGRLQVPRGPDWYPQYRAMDPAERSPMRTYTIRRMREGSGEMEVDFVLHGDAGPASRWALRARPGDRVVVIAPDRAQPDPGGVEWRPPEGVREVLLVADETALPAGANILEGLAAMPRPPAVQAFIEVPLAEDALPLPAPPQARVVWLPRATASGSRPHEHGVRLLDAVRAAEFTSAGVPATVGGAVDEIDIDREIVWERAADAACGFYAWIAGEAGVVMSIRRHLLGERGLPKSAITFMGYWRKGRALD
ncbi:MAG: siderophore-interacting protein [Pseudoxanthomonas sp.]